MTNQDSAHGQSDRTGNRILSRAILGGFLVLTVAMAGFGVLLVDRVETSLGSNRSYVGRLIEGEFPFSFVITVGERNAFAKLSTPQGSFELVGNTQLAWLMPTANMDRHVDYSQPDDFIPEQEPDLR